MIPTRSQNGSVGVPTTVPYVPCSVTGLCRWVDVHCLPQLPAPQRAAILVFTSTHFRVVSIWNPEHQEFIISKYTYTSACIPEVMRNLAGHPAKLWGNNFYVNASSDNVIFQKPHWLVRYLEVSYIIPLYNVHAILHYPIWYPIYYPVILPSGKLT